MKAAAKIQGIRRIMGAKKQRDKMLGERRQEKDGSKITATPSKRRDFILELFRALDRRMAQRLKVEQLFRFAQHLEFPGDIIDFQESGEYEDLCKAFGCDYRHGLDYAAFERIVNS